ncbi:MAG: Transcription antitermination protein nusG [candidate division TM6 bacterium GW2011_GWF2_32_72]|nr:MAG: Transcription antitermination protein nusG [candidate division TM6 bacterium GW2011_GWF2_32_72]
MKRWYVVQVFAGYEEAVKSGLEKRKKEEGFSETIGEILIPSAKVAGIIGEDAPQQQQLFPGYILVEMEMLPETKKFILSTPRISKFLGGKDPMPLSKKEIERIVGQVKGEVTISSEKSEIIVGSEVEIKDGPFAGFIGTVDSVDQENERLSVMVSIFGRLTPVELSFDQIKR